MSAACSICGSPTSNATYCRPCSGTLQWVSGYFDHVPALAGKITPQTRFIEDLAVESLDWMNWLLEAEEKLDIAIPDDRADRIHTVGAFVLYLQRAGATWPEGQTVSLRPRPRCWSPHVWDVVADRPADQVEP